MGREPNAYIFERAANDEDGNRAILHEAAGRLRARGATWLRVTAVDALHQPLGEGQRPHGFWFEGWDRRPSREASFNPPLTYAGRGERHLGGTHGQH